VDGVLLFAYKPRAGRKERKREEEKREEIVKIKEEETGSQKKGKKEAILHVCFELARGEL